MYKAEVVVCREAHHMMLAGTAWTGLELLLALSHYRFPPHNLAGYSVELLVQCWLFWGAWQVVILYNRLSAFHFAVWKPEITAV